MLRLFVIIYTDNNSRLSPHTKDTMNKNFVRDCGYIPCEIIEQPTKAELINFLEHNDFTIDDNIILHIISHGNIDGFGKLIDGSDSVPDKNAFIYWMDFINLCNGISSKCHSLLVNLGNICNSSSICNIQLPMNFDLISVKGKTGDTSKPRKRNRIFIDKINDKNLLTPYLRNEIN